MEDGGAEKPPSLVKGQEVSLGLGSLILIGVIVVIINNVTRNDEAVLRKLNAIEKRLDAMERRMEPLKALAAEKQPTPSEATPLFRSARRRP